MVPLLLSLVLAASALSPLADEPTGPEPGPDERRAVDSIREETLRAHLKFLADDLLEGRWPGSRGDHLARRYIASQFEALGLKPGAPGGGWFQPTPLDAFETQAPRSLDFKKGGETLSLARGDDFIATAGSAKARSGFHDAELVFVGYGIVAPEYGWDDFKDADLRGKVLLVMNNDPASDPKLFAGEIRLYYGRWDYKYEMAAKKGAAGAIIIHTTPSAAYPWSVVQSSFSGEQCEMPDQPGPRLEMTGWVTEEAARRLTQLGSADLDELRRSAEDRSFHPKALGITLTAELPSTVRRIESANVIGRLEGQDPSSRREAVIYTAHHDHLGMAPEGSAGADRIYNGAVDNASGVAMLLTVAAAYQKLPAPPRRSVLFAAVSAEEQGLLGSAWLAAHPPMPAGFLAAVINIDGVNIWGRTRDVPLVGRGKSSLDRVVEAAAAWQGRTVVADPFPDRGHFYRSDQFSFAKIGVPGVYLDTGTDFVGRPPGWGKERIEEWERTRYHQPSDEYRDDWDLAGAVEDARLLFLVGLAVAGDPALPRWTAGDEFEAARNAALMMRK